MIETYASGAGGSRSDVPPISQRAPRRRLGSWQRTSPRRLPKVLEISDEERALASFFANPTNEKLRKAHPLTRLEKYIAASPLVSAQLKGFVAVVAARCDPQSCDTIKFSYSDIARSIKSARKKASTSAQATVDRRTVINYGAELEALGMMVTELRHPVTQRDPKHPKNLHNRFRFVFPPWAGPVADAQRVDEDSDVDETRRDTRAAIEREHVDAGSPREALDVDELDVDELLAEAAALPPLPSSPVIAPPPAEMKALVSVRGSGFVELKTQPPRPGALPSPPARPMLAKCSTAAAVTNGVSSAEVEAHAARMRDGITALLELHAGEIDGLPADFAERVRKVAKRERLSLPTALIGIQDAVDKANGRRGRELADHVIACVKRVRDGRTPSPEAKAIVRRVDAALEATLAALRAPARGRGPP